MASAKKKDPGPIPVAAAVLLKRFPVELHRAMRIEAVRQGRNVGDLYAEACQAFLAQAKPGGTKRGL